MESKLFRVAYWIDEKGLRFKVREMEDVKETDKSFLTEGRRINKDRLMKIDTSFIENHKSIRYFIYCRENEIVEALSKLKEHIEKRVHQYKVEIDSLVTLMIKNG